MKIEIEVIDTIRRFAHHEHEVLAAMAHDFEHQVDLLYGEGADDAEGEEAPTTSPAAATPAAKDASKYAH